MKRLSFGELPKAWSRSSMEDSSFGPSSLERINSLGEGAPCSVVPPYVCMYVFNYFLYNAKYLDLEFSLHYFSIVEIYIILNFGSAIVTLNRTTFSKYIHTVVLTYSVSTLQSNRSKTAILHAYLLQVS